MPGNNLGRTPISESQIDSQYQTSNDGDGILDDAITDVIDILIDSTTKTLTSVEFQQNFTFRLADDSPSPTGPVTLNLPVTWDDEDTPTNTFDLFRGSFCIINNMSQPVTIQISGQSKPAPLVPIGGKRILVHDGVNVMAPSVEYDFGMWMPTTPGSSEVISQFDAVRPIWIPANFSGSKGSINVNPTATFVISVRIAGVEIGTISVSTGGVLTFATTGGSAKNASIGDVINFVAPSVTDATAAGMSATILGYTQ